MINNESSSHSNWTRPAGYWKELEGNYQQIIKAHNRAIRDRMEGDDASMRYHDTLAIIEEWLQHEFPPEVIWLGLEQVILETSAADEERCLEVAIDAGYSFLKSHGWLNTPGPWNKIVTWIVGLKISPLSRAKLALICGRYIAVDCETTGLSATHDRIIQLNLATFSHGRLISDTSTLVNPKEAIAPEVERFTGISNLDLQAAPGFADASEAMLNSINTSMLVTDNAEFLVDFLRAECERHNVEFKPYGVCCTYELAKVIDLKGKRDLRCLAGRFGIFDDKDVVRAGKLLPALVDGE
jgi:hypothetical protein